MAARRIDNPPERQLVKRESAALTRAAGGVEASALACRVGKSLLSDFGRFDTDRFMPVDVAIDLEAVTHGQPGWPHITQLMCRQAGGMFLALPPVEAMRPAELHAALTAAMKESNESHCGLIAALGDGVVSPAEARTQAAEALEAAERHLQLHALLTQIAEQG